MLAPVTHFLPLTHIRRARLLPVKGHVLVRAGQKVSALDVIARTYLKPRHILMDITPVVGNDRARARKAIERRVGEKVQAGDVIASSGGLFQRIARTPEDGVIIAISARQVMIETRDDLFELRAGFCGKVSEIIPDRGVIIETSGALFQGVWGNGQVNMGPLMIAASEPASELTAEQIVPAMNGMVVVGGYCASIDVLKAALEHKLHGLVLSSMSSSLLAPARNLKIPLILLEGFGKNPMNAVAYRLLAGNAQRDAAIHALAWDPMNGERPEIVIELPADGERCPETDSFNEGQTVRICIGAHAGLSGTLQRMLPGTTMLPAGLRAPAAEVAFESGEQVTVPLANMDVIE